MHFKMDHHAKIGAFLIATLAFLALILVYLVGRELTVRTPSASSGTGRMSSVPAEPPPKADQERIQGDRGSGLESASGGFVSPFSAPEARPLTESGDLLTRQWNEEGLALYTKGEYEAAADRFGKALDRSPGHSVLRENLAYAKGSRGWQLIESGQYQEALLSFQEALNLSASGGVEDAAFYMGMGLIYYRLKEEDRAIEMLKTAILQRSNDAQPYKLLGEIYSMRDEMDMAVGYLEKAVELDPSDRELAQRLAKAQRERKTQGAFQQEATLHFTVKFEGREERDVAAQIIDLLEEAYREIGQALSAFPQAPITVILYSNQQFRDVTLTPSWSQGLFDGKIRLPIEGSGKDPTLLKKVVDHEYAHAVIYDLCKGRVPTWLNEGIALNLEGDNTARWEHALLNQIKQDQNLIPLKNLHGSFMAFPDDRAALAYAESHSATQYLMDRYGLYRIKELLLTLAGESSFEAAFENQFLVDYTEFERDWLRQIERRAHEGA